VVLNGGVVTLDALVLESASTTPSTATPVDGVGDGGGGGAAGAVVSTVLLVAIGVIEFAAANNRAL
jgi:hypothetical protein